MFNYVKYLSLYVLMFFAYLYDSLKCNLNLETWGVVQNNKRLNIYRVLCLITQHKQILLAVYHIMSQTRNVCHRRNVRSGIGYGLH